MKHYIGVLTYYDVNQNLRATPMRFSSTNKKQAAEIVRQQARDRLKLKSCDLVDIHIILDS